MRLASLGPSRRGRRCQQETLSSPTVATAVQLSLAAVAVFPLPTTAAAVLVSPLAVAVFPSPPKPAMAVLVSPLAVAVFSSPA